MNTLVVDLDGTLIQSDGTPNTALIEKLRQCHLGGWRIIVSTARNMRKYQGDLTKIQAFTSIEVIEWLRQNRVPYDGLHLGKPWCGTDGYYIDDRALRPEEFLAKEDL
jgi:capsule biosynthesis phosphatase